MKALAYITGTAVAAMVAMVAAPSNAQPINGSFGFVPVGAVTLNTGDITAGTTSKTYTQPDETVNIPGTHDLTLITDGNPVHLSNPTFDIAPGTTGPVPTGPFTVMVDAGGGNTLTFTYTTTKTSSREPTTAVNPGDIGAGFLASQFTGTLTAATGPNFGAFTLGRPSLLAQNCNQAAIGGAINCSDTVAVGTAIVPAPEPGSLVLLGSALVGFGLFRRRRRTAA